VFDDPRRYLHGDSLPHEEAVRDERTAFSDGLRAFMTMLADGGYEVARQPVS
jgi:hypothetical protein